MNVPLLDLKAQYKTIKNDIDKAVLEIFESQYFIMGPNVKKCEELIAEYSNCKFACGVSSGTDALLLSLMNEGITNGDEVITSPYTFFATVGSIARLGAKPVFVDIDPVSYNINVDKIEEKITEKTKAIIPIHLYGQMADMNPIMKLAKKYNLCVIEDAAQAIGAEYKGKRAGSIGHYACFSFFPSKNLGAAGDGGMIVSNDAKRAEKLDIMRVHGSSPKYYHKYLSGNFRLDAIQAAVVMVKLKHLDKWSNQRNENALRYNSLFEAKGLISNDYVSIPQTVTNRHIYNQYVIRVKKRDALWDFLKANSIGVEVYYPIPVHLQECFSNLAYKEGDFPESELAAKETLALPIFPELSSEQAEFVVDKIAEFYNIKS